MMRRIFIGSFLVLLYSCTTNNKYCMDNSSDILYNHVFRDSIGLPPISNEFSGTKNNWKITFLRNEGVSNPLYKLSYVCRSNSEHHRYILKNSDTLIVGFSHDYNSIELPIFLDTKNGMKSISKEQFVEIVITENLFSYGDLIYNMKGDF